MSSRLSREWKIRSILCFGLVLAHNVCSGGAQDDRISYNLIDTNSSFTRSGANLYKKNAAKFNKNFSKYVSKYEDALATDEIFKELVIKPTGYYLSKLPNATSAAVSKGQKLLYEDIWRDKRGALHLAGIIKCATNCDPLSYKGYGCYCGFLGNGQPVDGIDTCCKMHDWCYTTTSCMDLEWHLPYFVPFKWKCNGASPYCIPGKTSKTDRNSCSHQLCECDREFAMCLQKYLPCPKSKAVCKNKKRLWQNLLMGFGSGKGVHDPKHKVSDKHFHHRDIHGPPHPHKPPPLFHIPAPIYPKRGFRIRHRLGK